MIEPKKHHTDKSNQSNSQSFKRTVRRREINPLDYDHPYPSMAELATRLALGYDNQRTCAAYYRNMRLINEHFRCDPALISEGQLRDYFLHVKALKQWKPKTIRQSLASCRFFFV